MKTLNNVLEIHRADLPQYYKVNLKTGFLIYSNDGSNCKHCNIRHAETINFTKVILKEVNHILSKKLTFTITVTSKDYVKKWAKHFKLIGILKLPIGYRKNFQYHATFLTNNKNYTNYDNYEKRTTEIKEIS